MKVCTVFFSVLSLLSRRHSCHIKVKCYLTMAYNSKQVKFVKTGKYCISEKTAFYENLFTDPRRSNSYVMRLPQYGADVRRNVCNV